MNNQLLDPAITWHDIDFATLRPEHFAQAFDTLLPLVRANHEHSVTEAPLTYEGLLGSAESDQLDRVSMLLEHLNNVVDSPGLRKVYKHYVPLVATMQQELALDERGPMRLRQYLDTEEAGNLAPLNRRIIDELLRSYQREGAYRDSVTKARLAELAAQEAELAEQFESNLTDFADNAALVFAPEDLAGVPARTLENATLLADGRYEISMETDGFSDIESYCEVESTRRAVYEYELKEGAEAPYDNRGLLVDIVNVAQERARLLGFESYAHYAMQGSMLKTPAVATAFQTNLAQRSFGQARRESEEVTAFGTQLLGRTPQFHDRPYLVEQLRKARYDLDSEEVRKYFPVKAVVAGLFSLVEQLYDISFVENTTRSTWHPDVQTYDMVDKTDGRSLGFIYLDLFKRKHKTDGAWMIPAQSRHVDDERTYLPVTYLVCNVARDKGREPTLAFEEVVTLFHEMGHTLHNQLSEVDDEFFSGLNEVPEDAVELPSQFLENFCWDYETIRLISRHTETGEPMPASEFDRLRASRTFMGGTVVLTTAKHALIDQLIYSTPGIDPFAAEAQIMDTWAARPRDPRVLDLVAFSHIFAGDYSARYYAYQWAEVLSADAFAALKEEGQSFPDQKPAALRFRKHVLASGGYSDMAENFRAFRQRDPDVQHLLRAYGVD